MRKRTLFFVGIAGLAAAVAWWLFFGSTPAQPNLTANERQEILAVQDTRLSEGSHDAPVKIIEYVDVLCPYCAKASQPGDIIPSMLEEYVETGKAHYEVRLVAKTAPDSQRAGEGAYCAAEQDAFFAYLDKAYDDTWRQYYSRDADVLDVSMFQEGAIFTFVRSIPEINHLQWQDCMKQNAYADVMNKHADELRRLDAYGTPTMVVDDISYTGTPEYSAFQAVINASLNEKRAHEEAE